MTMPEEVTRDLMRRALFNLRYVELARNPDGQMRLLNGLDPELNEVITDDWIRPAIEWNGPNFEVTQLLNSFLLALVHPWENHFQKTLEGWTLQDAALAWNMPTIDRERKGKRVNNDSVASWIAFFRNAMAHGNVKMFPDGHGQISYVQLWNYRPQPAGAPPPPTQEWTFARVTVDQMRQLLFAFAAMTEELMRRAGNEAARRRVDQIKADSVA